LLVERQKKGGSVYEGKKQSPKSRKKKTMWLAVKPKHWGMPRSEERSSLEKGQKIRERGLQKEKTGTTPRLHTPPKQTRVSGKNSRGLKKTQGGT